MPLVDLLRGCLKYLLEHMLQGQKVGGSVWRHGVLVAVAWCLG